MVWLFRQLDPTSWKYICCYLVWLGIKCFAETKWRRTTGMTDERDTFNKNLKKQTCHMYGKIMRTSKKRLSEAMDDVCGGAGFIKDEAVLLFSSSDSSCLWFLDSSHTNTLNTCLPYPTHTHTHLLFFTSGSGFSRKIKVTSQRLHFKSIRVAPWAPWASKSKPLGDPSSPGVEFLPLLLVLHELLLHLFHGALRRRTVLFWEDVREGECLALCLMGRNKISCNICAFLT